MFGYVRPRKDELRVRELEDYQAAYCGLCRAIGRRHGFVARMFLNYDLVFLAILLSRQKERPVAARCRCPARLWCRKKPCAVSEELDLAADTSTILSYWKLRDALWDGGPLAGIGARFLLLLIRRGYRRAAARRPVFDRVVSEALEELRGLEQANCSSLDRTADTFARILRAAVPGTGEAARDRAAGELLYHLGRWIYLVDAWDDLEADAKRGGYNPISARFPGAEKAQREYLRTTMRHSLNLACSAYHLLETSYWSGVIENILYLGLPTVEELVFTGRWGKRNHNRRMET